MVHRSLYHDARGNRNNDELEENEEEVDGEQYSQQDVIKYINQIHTIKRSAESLKALFDSADAGAGPLVLDDVMDRHGIVFDERSTNLQNAGTIESIFTNLKDKGGVTPQKIEPQKQSIQYRNF